MYGGKITGDLIHADDKTYFGDGDSTMVMFKIRMMIMMRLKMMLRFTR